MQPGQTSKCLGRLGLAVRGVGVQVVDHLLKDGSVDPPACQSLLSAAKKQSVLHAALCTAAIWPGQRCSVCPAAGCPSRQ